MSSTPEEIARDIRDIYLCLDRNYTLLLSLSRMGRKKTDLAEVIPAGRLAEVKNSMEMLGKIRRQESQGSLGFPRGFDFRKNNRDVRQISYGQGRVVRSVSAALLGKPCAYIVSLGIGDGKIASKYMKGQSACLTGIDLHREYLAEAKKLIPGLTAVVCDLNLLHEKKLPLPDSSSDIVECTMTAHHIEDFPMLLREISRIMRKGGRFFYLDLADKTRTEKKMAFHDVHRHPPFHGIEFFRNHTQIKSEVRKFFKITNYERIGPGILFLEAVK